MNILIAYQDDHSPLKKVTIIAVMVRITFRFCFVIHSVMTYIKALMLRADLVVVRAGASISPFSGGKNES